MQLMYSIDSDNLPVFLGPKNRPIRGVPVQFFLVGYKPHRVLEGLQGVGF